MAVDSYKNGETPRVHGSYRLTSYVLFLLDEYFPLQEELLPPTAEDLEEQEKRHRRLEYQREANKRWYSKKKQESE